MSSTIAPAWGLAMRSLRNIRRLPSAFVPALMMPLVQVIAFSGTFAGITVVQGFPTDRSVNWYLPLAVTMGSSFAGLGTGFAMIRDLQSGFYDRLRMSPAGRRSLLLGPFIAAWARALIAVVLVLIVGVTLGARPTSWVAIPSLIAVGLGTATLGTGWGIGLAYRFGDMRAAAIMQLTLFLGLFLTDAQTPIDVMRGWLVPVATVNPLSRVLGLARQGFIDDGASWATTIWGLITLIAVSTATGMFAMAGLRHLDD